MEKTNFGLLELLNLAKGEPNLPQHTTSKTFIPDFPQEKSRLFIPTVYNSKPK